jgi:molybdate transport system regulatory protein
MNRFAGHIAVWKTEGHLTLIDVTCGEITFKAVVLESPETLPEIADGNEVDVIFKETEVIIGLDPMSPISLRNRILCVIDDIDHGSLLCNLRMKCSEGSINSIITSHAVKQLQLEIGKKVWAMIKTNEVMLEFK